MYSLFQSNEIRLEYPLTLSTSKYAGLLLSKYEKFTPLSHKKELKCLCLHKLQVSYVKMCSENSNVCYTKAVFWYIKQGRGTWLYKAFCLCKVINFVTSEIGCGFWWRLTLQWIPPGGTVISLLFFPPEGWSFGCSSWNCINQLLNEVLFLSAQAHCYPSDPSGLKPN